MLAAAAAAALVIAPLAALAHDPAAVHSEDKRYIAGSVEAEPAADEAVGVVDCPENLVALTEHAGGVAGGACFDVSAFPGHSFVLSAMDDMTTSVSMFAGFDGDGDGCVGCTPGADPAWEGISSLGGVISGDTLAVFVRAFAINEDGEPHMATTGTLHLDVFLPGGGPCGRPDPAGQPNEKCGHSFHGDLPYPYPCLAGCQ
jgi:hypothetical protein